MPALSRMIRFVLVFCLVAVALGPVGGQSSSESTAFYMVSIWYRKYDLMCGGTIITKRFILVLRACGMLSMKYLRVHVAGRNVYFVDHVHEQPGPDPKLALLELDRDIEVPQKYWRPVRLPDEGAALPVGTVGLAVNVKKVGTAGYTIVEAHVPVIPISNCHINSTSAFCVGYKRGGPDACGGGTSGASFMVNDTLMGVLRRSVGCREHMDDPKLNNYPSLYETVADKRSWIKAVTGV